MFFSSIRRKLTLVVMGMSASALILAGALIVFGQMTAFRKNLARDLVLQTDMIANNSLAAVSFADPDDAALILGSLASRPSISYAVVRIADGTALATFRRPGFDAAPQSFPVEGETHVFKSGWLLAQKPVVLEGSTIGSVFLQSDLREINAFRRRIVETVLTSLLVVLLIAWVVSYKVQKLISGPIERLTGMVRDVSRRRDFSLRATHIGHDEIGVLANAFNEMLCEVESRDKQLKDREQRTKDYLNVAGVMIVAFDPGGKVTLINPKGCELLGLDEADVVGKDWFATFIPARVRERSKKDFDTFVRDAVGRVLHYENFILTGWGGERLVAWKNSLIRDDLGRVIAVLASGEDITERRQSEAREAALQEELARAERMKSIGVLAGGVAHDLNNILGPVVALPEFIRGDLDAAGNGDVNACESILKSVDMIENSGQRAASVVRDLLAVSRRGHYTRIPLDINKLSSLSHDSICIRNLSKTYPNASIRLCISDDTLPVLASLDHLCRVVDNLVRNAVEALNGNGTVTITAEKKVLSMPHVGYATVPPGEYATITVADTGCGMNMDELGRIFEPFYKNKKKTERSGSGLGLSIVHGIVDDHDGFIDVASAPGAGTTFCLYFPLVKPIDETVRLDNSESLIAGHGHILVVDDEPGQRFLACRSLTRMGYTVGDIDNGNAAVKLFAEAHARHHVSPYDLVLLDMTMEPGFDGVDTLLAIRAFFPEQKVLIVSGHAEDDRSATALALGAAWLNKPYKLNALAKAVADMLSDQS